MTNADKIAAIQEIIAGMPKWAGHSALTAILDDYQQPRALFRWFHPSRWRYKKRGSAYNVLTATAEAQCATGPINEGDHVTVYQGDDDNWHVRKTVEFQDGRFERIDLTEGWPAASLTPVSEAENTALDAMERACKLVDDWLWLHDGATGADAERNLKRDIAAAITEARAAAIEECVKWHEEYARSEDNRALSCRDQHNDAAYHATLAVAAKHRGYAAELRAIATQPAQSGE